MTEERKYTEAEREAAVREWVNRCVNVSGGVFPLLG